VSEIEQISILVVDDDDDLREVIARRFQRRGHDVENTGSPTDALQRVGATHFDVAILDIAMPEMDGVALLERMRQVDPDTQVIMLTGDGTLETAIRAVKLGAFNYLTKPCKLAELEVQVQRAHEQAKVTRENQALKTMLRRSEPPCAIIGKTPVIQDMLHLVEKVAPTNSPVLIQGESGTGKELVARALHRGSARADKPMIVINCAALQETLLESELVGHEKGAFTSAISAKPGLFELASGGTLFIDEIGEMAPALQAKLLRALEDGRIRRVGSIREIRTDVRFLAATNKNLAEEVAAGRFRRDLFYRLNVITIATPPLRERADDVPLLVHHFLERDSNARPQIHRDALELLVRYHWPGNVRELANVIERAKILAEGPVITALDLPAELTTASRGEALPQPPATTSRRGLDLGSMERDHILRALESQGGNKVKTARALGISRRRLYRLIEKHRIGDSDSATREGASPPGN
jgi:DNA-binding NtrC family response regulator